MRATISLLSLLVAGCVQAQAGTPDPDTAAPLAASPCLASFTAHFACPTVGPADLSVQVVLASDGSPLVQSSDDRVEGTAIPTAGTACRVDVYRVEDSGGPLLRHGEIRLDAGNPVARAATARSATTLYGCDLTVTK